MTMCCEMEKCRWLDDVNDVDARMRGQTWFASAISSVGAGYGRTEARAIAELEETYDPIDFRTL
jgi:hypothetical protein